MKKIGITNSVALFLIIISFAIFMPLYVFVFFPNEKPIFFEFIRYKPRIYGFTALGTFLVNFFSIVLSSTGVYIIGFLYLWIINRNKFFHSLFPIFFLAKLKTRKFNINNKSKKILIYIVKLFFISVWIVFLGNDIFWMMSKYNTYNTPSTLYWYIVLTLINLINFNIFFLYLLFIQNKTFNLKKLKRKTK
ncbi:hypothetical protein RRG40_00875 [Mycoplasmopsis felis]|uniref:hypothetical protein n=1 Tax=Mycoplasmopsis felis TaxID=33923 RepID=UPI002AFF37FB|nr:hypothetical protein [Mycoplasmopsis felis]WQQ05236.1 hypothetical protein RRG59_02660 [Mycoplasmopsis felis]